MTIFWEFAKRPEPEYYDVCIRKAENTWSKATHRLGGILFRLYWGLYCHGGIKLERERLVMIVFQMRRIVYRQIGNRFGGSSMRSLVALVRHGSEMCLFTILCGI